MTTPAVDLTREACERRLYEALYAITMHPERWDQGTWVSRYEGSKSIRGDERWPCGTTGCLAGTVVVQEGLTYNVDDDGDGIVISEAGIRLIRGVDPDETEWDIYGWRELGKKLLGLDDLYAGRLFSPSMMLAELWATAAEITDNRVALPDDLRSRVMTIDDRLIR